LEDFDNGETHSQNSFASPETTREAYSIAGTLLFSHGISNKTSIELDTSQPLTEEMTSILLSIYHHHVDPIVKPLHWPSAVSAIQSRNTEAKSEAQWTRLHALERSILFPALCTMTDSECQEQLYCNRDSLMQHLGIEAESAFSKAKLLEDPDLTVLQAFVIYLVSLSLLWMPSQSSVASIIQCSCWS